MLLAVEVLEVVRRSSNVLDSLWEEVNELHVEVGSPVLNVDEVSGGGVDPHP